MFGNNNEAQPQKPLTWDAYLNAVKTTTPQYTPPSAATEGPNYGSAAGISGTRSSIPATPIDYGRMAAILGSGALRGGKAPMGPLPQAPAPAPAPQQKPQNPFESFLSQLLGAIPGFQGLPRNDA